MTLYFNVRYLYIHTYAFDGKSMALFVTISLHIPHQNSIQLANYSLSMLYDDQKLMIFVTIYFHKEIVSNYKWPRDLKLYVPHERKFPYVCVCVCACAEEWALIGFFPLSVNLQCTKTQQYMNGWKHKMNHTKNQTNKKGTFYDKSSDSFKRRNFFSPNCVCMTNKSFWCIKYKCIHIVWDDG